MLNPRKHLRLRSKRAAGRRNLRFDLLEDRRLLAGLEGGIIQVHVFEDMQSQRVASESTKPAVERVVYLDLNRDGFFQSSEPVAITDADGSATFDGLAPGNYSVRLIGNHRTVVETTARHPEEAGALTLGTGVRRSVHWESDSVGWFAGDRTLQQWDLDRGAKLQEYDLGGVIESVKSIQDSRVVAMINVDGKRQLVSANLRTGVIESLSHGLNGMDSWTVLGQDVWVRAASEQGFGVYRIPAPSNVATTQPFDIPSPEIDGLTTVSTIHAIGTDDLVVIEQLTEGTTRLSSYQKSAAGWQLTAERTFESKIRFASALSDASLFAIESEEGVSILNNTSGLPTIEVLEQAIGPTVFDASRGILMTRSRQDANQVFGFSHFDWKRLFSLAVPKASLSSQDQADWTMGYLNDSFVSVAEGQIYRHGLTASSGASAEISDGNLQHVAIGIRSRGLNRAPTLNELPDFETDEDVPLPLPYEAISKAAIDADGDTLYFFVRTPAEHGRLQWSSTAFAVFVPTPDVNGQDRLVIQAFDGLSWSDSQTLQIDVRPVNDPPTGFTGESEYRVAEREPGAVLGQFSASDPDTDAVYRYIVSDGRFVVRDGVLALTENVALDFEAMSTIVLSVTAVEVKNGDSVRQQVTVQVQDRNDPPQGIILSGNGSIPEKVAPYVVGNIGVIDPDRSEIYDIGVSDSRFEVVNNTVRVKPGSGVTYTDPGWIELSFVAVSRSTGDTVRRTERLRVIKDDTPYHNDANPLDVNGDGYVSPLDPLIIINYINTRGSGPVVTGEGEAGGDLDVDGDGRVSPLDILIVINALNAQRHQGDGKGNSGNSSGGNPPGGEGEGNGNAPLIQAPFNEEDLPGRRSRSQSGTPIRFR